VAVPSSPAETTPAAASENLPTDADDLPGFDEAVHPEPEPEPTPPILARPKLPEAAEPKKPARTFHMSPFDEDEYDIPTFLRRQAD
jgi:hypothetical protein